jgi:hypothetical protein
LLIDQVRVLYTTLCDKVRQSLATGRWFSTGARVSSTNKTDRHDITKILLKMALASIAGIVFGNCFTETNVQKIRFL